MDKYVVYVIMSLYKNDRYHIVKEAIESVLNQSYSNIVLYIKGDGVLDSQVLSYISSLVDPRVLFFSRVENKGLAVSLNELLETILSNDNCKYIARMDADDIAHPDRFEKQIQYLRSNAEVDCLGSWAIEITEDGKEYFRKKMPESHEDCLELFKKRDCLIHPSVMFRKSYFEKAGLYPEDTYFGEDTIMWAQGFASGCKFANIPEFLLKFRLDENFFKRRRGLKHAKSILSLRRRVNHMLGFGFKETIYSYLYAIAKLMPTAVLNIIYKTAR